MSSPSTTSYSLLQAVFQAARKTFGRSKNVFKLQGEEFNVCLRELKAILDNVRAHDLGMKSNKIRKMTIIPPVLKLYTKSISRLFT